MLKRLAYGSAGIVLLLLSASFSYFAFYVTRSEVLPALRGGSLNVDTSTMILNVTWNGNEIYVVIIAYLLLAGAFAYGAIRLFNAARKRN